MFARRSRRCTQWALGTASLVALAGCVVGCGGDSSSVANPILDGSLGEKDSATQEPSNEAGGGDSTVGDETPAGDDAPSGVVGDDSGTQNPGDAGGDAGAPGDSGSAAGDAGDAGSATDGGGDAGVIDSGGVDSSAPGDAGASDGSAVGTVPCGTGTCTASSETCCYGATANPSCVATGACTGTTIDCRNTANCQGGDICCLMARGGSLEAACATSASCTGVRLCADGDCPANQTCTRGLCVPNGPGLDAGFPVFDGGFPGFDGGFRGFDGGFPFP